MKTDVIVIGSGASGMTSAIILAKAGFKVLVVEQHSIAGGLMQTYRRNKIPLPTGVHFLGSLAPQQVLWTYFKYLGVMDRIKITKMNEDCFLRLHFPHLSFEIPQCHSDYEQKLLSLFPHEREGIKKYFEQMKRCAALIPYHTPNPDNTQIPIEYFRTSLEAFLDSIIKNEELKNILKSFVIFYGFPAEECPLFIHFVVADNYLKSAWKIQETGNSLATAFCEALASHGGKVRLNARVDSIMFKDEAAQGVVLDSGETIQASRVIYSGHPKNLLDLVPANILLKRISNGINNTPETITFLSVNVLWDAATCPFSYEANCFFNQSNPDAVFKCKQVSEENIPSILFCGAASSANNGKYVISTLCEAPYDVWKSWASTHVGKRSSAYVNFKDKLSKRILNRLKTAWPVCQEKLSVLDSFSPLTLRDYTGSHNGSPYGLQKTPSSKVLWKLAMQGNATGLYLVGQSLFAPGILGAVASAMHCCSQILGHQKLISQILKETGN